MRVAARACATLALGAALGGCVAMAALPVLAGGAMVAGGNAEIRAATPRPKPARVAAVPRSEEMTAGSGVALADVAAAPMTEAAPDPSDPWQQFFAYALAKAPDVAEEDGAARSALLEANPSLDLPRTRACQSDVPAVLIDLDPETRPFIAAAAKPPRAGLVTGLARLREAGLAVVWITALPASNVSDVAETLRASGLDPQGADALLLARNPQDRKQVLREEANRDVCVIAIAGDRKADFDELFDYLLDPSRAFALDTMLGVGWFLAPPPLG